MITAFLLTFLSSGCNQKEIDFDGLYPFFLHGISVYADAQFEKDAKDIKERMENEKDPKELSKLQALLEKLKKENDRVHALHAKAVTTLEVPPNWPTGDSESCK